MAGYVQMHFDVAERKHYFGDDWDCYPDDSYGYYLASCKTDSTAMRSIGEIADSADVISMMNTSRLDHSDEDNIRFESFLTFRHFLLHVLKIFEVEENEAEVVAKKTWSGELIDDKKLIQRFEAVFPRKQHVGETVERFGLCLLRCRF
ncbi:hypothetical protein [Paenibacillus sp. 1_12]|uniref:hypothetical protein n=1 Tax=Paenibacillus sp. 1_12 TaxID=1566278 RepID=UPI00116063E5|nr:hypothetical protein [Paenibacillus sp. 1_12]